jgi:TonB family protein
MYRVAWSAGFVLALASFGIAPAAQPSAASGWCSGFVARVEPLDRLGNRYAVALATHDGSHRTSGTLALYHGGDRYDVCFSGANAFDPRDENAIPSAIVVRFPAPVAIEEATVTSIDGTACAPLSEPWLSGRPVTPLIGSIRVGLGARARGAARISDNAEFWTRWSAAAISAPESAVTDAVAGDARIECRRPPIRATTTHAIGPQLSPEAENRNLSGHVQILVTLDDKNAVMTTRVERSSGFAELDRSALQIAQGSEFRSPVLHCSAYGGSYIFDALFGT